MDVVGNFRLLQHFIHSHQIKAHRYLEKIFFSFQQKESGLPSVLTFQFLFFIFTFISEFNRCDSKKNPVLTGLVLTCGERGIRTPGTRKGSTVFKTAAIDRSAISPKKWGKDILYIFAPPKLFIFLYQITALDVLSLYIPSPCLTSKAA